MKEYLGVFVNELQSAQLIIKILQEEIKSLSTGPGNQDNLSSCDECKSYKKYHTTIGKDSMWKEIKRNKHSAVQPKKMLNSARQQNSYIPLNHMAKSKKRDKSETVKTGQLIKTTNRYTPLTKVRAYNEGTLPVIVNGDISTEGNIKVTNRNASHKEDSENDETKPKKRKIIIIGDSHARGCAREISNYLGKEFEVSGTVMLGSGLANVTALAHEEILKPNLR